MRNTGIGQTSNLFVHRLKADRALNGDYQGMNTRFAILVTVTVGLLGFGNVAAAAKSLGHDTVPQQVFDGMHRSFMADRAKGVHALFQFDLSGPNGGLWWIEVNDGRCKFGRGRLQNPGVTLLASDHDWVSLSNGTLPGLWAYLTGRLKIHGDQKLARELDDLFNY